MKKHMYYSIMKTLLSLQVKMLQALGLKSTLITDGSSPINLFNTASGLIGGLVPVKRRRGDAAANVSDDEDD
jgi:major vault protein